MSRAPLTPSKACSSRRARTRWLTIPIHGSVFMKRTCRSLQQILQRRESGDWSCRSSRRKMASKVSTQMRSRVPRIASILRRLIQVGKLIKIENVHLPLFAIPTGTAGNSFDSRPAVQNDPVVGYNDSRFGELNASPPNTAPVSNNGSSKFPFQYPVGNPVPNAQYTFTKTLQFDPRGEGRINSSYDVRPVIEIGLLPTHGNVAPTPTPSAGNYTGNVVAVQLNGFAGNVKVYRR